MGLCKCPKRKVTNQFCYEHRVNVCESCMVNNHPKCIVLSYLKWLQDGDYNPICELCENKLIDDECIRLVCYHIFHWHCLDNYARQMPRTIAPAGYTCPSCKSPLFPPPNLVSPVADVLRDKLKSVEWTRSGLDLHSITEGESPMIPKAERVYANDDSSFLENESSRMIRDTVVEVDKNGSEDNIPRRLGHASSSKRAYTTLLNNDDDDENKYIRRPMSEKFGRYAARSKYFQFYSRHRYRRIFVVIVVLFIGFFFFMLILEKIGNHSDVGDLELDPMFNPNIHVKDS